MQACVAFTTTAASCSDGERIMQAWDGCTLHERVWIPGKLQIVRIQDALMLSLALMMRPPTQHGV